MSQRDEQTFYDAVGGHDTFVRIVDRFYEGVATDSELRPLYPDQDLSAAAHRLTMFLEQYWGGPTTYSQQRGHPRLGMRHAPFAVTARARDRWLLHMRTAIDEAGMAPAPTAQMWAYVERAAHFLVNTLDEDERARDVPRSSVGGTLEQTTENVALVSGEPAGRSGGEVDGSQ